MIERSVPRVAGDVGVAPLLQLPVLALDVLGRRVEVQLEEGVVVHRDRSLEGLGEHAVRVEVEVAAVLVVVVARFVRGQRQ
jgi:hypothetical protein